jgi:rsbT antagonist protein RsbS
VAGTTILRTGDLLVVPIQTEVGDREALRLQEDLTTEIVSSGARGVLIDISALGFVDSFIARVIAETAEMTRLLGAQTVLAGMRPAVAITLVELGVALPGVLTALDAQRGLDLLAARLRSEPGTR